MLVSTILPMQWRHDWNEFKMNLAPRLAHKIINIPHTCTQSSWKVQSFARSCRQHTSYHYAFTFCRMVDTNSENTVYLFWCFGQGTVSEKVREREKIQLNVINECKPIVVNVKMNTDVHYCLCWKIGLAAANAFSLFVVVLFLRYLFGGGEKATNSIYDLIRISVFLPWFHSNIVIFLFCCLWCAWDCRFFKYSRTPEARNRHKHKINELQTKSDREKNTICPTHVFHFSFWMK